MCNKMVQSLLVPEGICSLCVYGKTRNKPGPLKIIFIIDSCDYCFLKLINSGLFKMSKIIFKKVHHSFHFVASSPVTQIFILLT